MLPADSGIVDVTKGPYGARGDGKTDDTEALQKAINDYTGKRNPIYLPAGTYLVSKTLLWPENDRKGEHVWGFTHIQGQGRGRTIIRLKDGTFKEPSRPVAVMSAGRHGSADWFYNHVRDLTIDTGKDNAGAIGLQFFSNNTGSVRSVAIVSGDGEGRVGLDLGYNDMNGPLLVKDLYVDGFEVGVSLGYTVNSQTFERVELLNQGEAGLQNNGQCASVRGLTCKGTVPGVVNQGGLLALIDSRFEALPGSSGKPAIINKSALYARNVSTKGYNKAIESEGSQGAAGPVVNEFVSRAPTTLFKDGKKANVPQIKETPEVAAEDPRTWASVVKFGADPTAGQDSADAIQKAIDSGATTVYFPTGGYIISRPILVRNKVRRVIGFNSVFDYFAKVKPAFRVVDGESPVVSIEDFSPLGGGLVHESDRTVVLRDLELRTYEGKGRGDLFVEDVGAGPWAFGRQNVWARQFNVENEGTHVTNRGGNLWILGLKTERGGTLVETNEGGLTRIDGGLSYTTTAGKLAPMFVANDSTVSLSFAEVCYSGDPFATLLRETRKGVTKSLPRTDPLWTGAFVLYPGMSRD